MQMKEISRGDAEDAEKGKAVEYCGAGRLEACITISGRLEAFTTILGRLEACITILSRLEGYTTISGKDVRL